MKKEYRTVIDISCEGLDKMIISAGKIGHQIEIVPDDLIKLINGKTESITEK
jgi:Cys-tRNA(Pro)/Cys-tRNA(Cys) deacylase